jgi:hypothetical protein
VRRRKTEGERRTGPVICLVIALLVTWGLGAGGCEAGTPAPPVSPVSPVLPVEMVDSHSLNAHSAADRVSRVSPAWLAYPGEEPVEGDLELVCQLRRGGSRGVVLERARLITWGQTNIPFTWDVSGLGPGWYEIFCRLSTSDGEILLLVDLAGQDCVEGCGFGFVEHFKLE